MRFKTFAGRDLAEIVPRIRDELGPDAVILKQRPTRLGGVGGFFAQRGVEVLAADHAPTTPQLAAPSAAAAHNASTVTATLTASAAPTTTTPRGGVDIADNEQTQETLLRETFANALDARVASVPAALDESPQPPVRRVTAAAARVASSDTAAGAYQPRLRPFEPVRIASQPADGGLKLTAHHAPASPAPLDEEAADLALELERSGIPTVLADELVREVRFHVQPFVAGGSLRDLTRRRIAARIRCEQGWAAEGAPRRIAVVGSAGVGKTTAIANLATGFARVGMTVGLVVLERAVDPDQGLLPRLGAAGSEADRALAYMAGADVVRIASEVEARRGEKRLVTRDVVLIDTPADVDGALLGTLAPNEVHAVVPLGLADREVSATLTRLARLGAQRMLVTKTDEARFAGPLYALATQFDLPLSYLGTGPAIPGGLIPADGGLIAQRILPIG
jgi:flagellar biosynthesis protein FlhF